MYAYLFLGLLVIGTHAANVEKQAIQQGAKVIESAQTGKKVRECSCEEQEKCVGEMKQQIQGCFDGCWPIIEKDFKIVKKPDTLKQCFTGKKYVVDDILECLQSDAKTCVKGKDGPQVEYTDIKLFLDKGEKKLHKQANALTTAFGDDGKEVIDAAFKVGKCMKDCFLKKNAGGFCFDKAECQPKIEADDAPNAVQKCIKQIGWKKQAHELCQCSTKAGVEGMEKYCGLIDTVAKSNAKIPTARRR
jgi:hypothetical protein|uniref:Uncharacterized protein n=1 Tax=Panagrolaimus sp. PS1159 TaxID=55785 RepID=A0AC35GTH2_9BILA